MQNFLKLFLLFLISKKITAYSVEILNKTTCNVQHFERYNLKYKCFGPIINPKDECKFFIIDFKSTNKLLECFGSSYWDTLNTNVPLYYFKITNLLTIKNCQLKNTTTLINITKLIGAENTRELHLKMFRKKITYLNDDLFRGFNNLRKLYIINNYKLRNLTDNTFQYLTNVRGIHLSSNKLLEIPENIFQPLANNLKYLILSNNTLKFIKSNTFRNLRLLKNLLLDRNKINNITFDMFQDLINLKKLHLAGNEIKILPENVFSNLKNLKELYIGYNNLTSISENIFEKLENLTILSLKGNYFKILPEKIFHNLIQLKVLYLSRNYLTTISKYVLIVITKNLFYLMSIVLIIFTKKNSIFY